MHAGATTPSRTREEEEILRIREKCRDAAVLYGINALGFAILVENLSLLLEHGTRRTETNQAVTSVTASVSARSAKNENKALDKEAGKGEQPEVLAKPDQRLKRAKRLRRRAKKLISKAFAWARRVEHTTTQ